MADRPKMPAPPDGCVYGPWWDGRWWSLIDNKSLSDNIVRAAWMEIGWATMEFNDPSDTELLRLAKELDARNARINELEEALESSVGWYNYCLELWDWTRFPDTKKMVIQRKAKAEALLKGDQDDRTYS